MLEEYYQHIFFSLVEQHVCETTIYCQAFRQLANISSRQFCVRLASGGDPTYAFNVRMTGEEVHGTSKLTFPFSFDGECTY